MKKIYFLFILLQMGAVWGLFAQEVTKVSKPILPLSSWLPVVYEDNVRGGYHQVADLAERTTLATALKEAGMLIWQQDTHVTYQWDGTTWRQVQLVRNWEVGSNFFIGDIFLNNNTSLVIAKTNGTIASGANPLTDKTNWTSILGSSLASGQILVGNTSGVATAIDLSGDVTLTNSGVTAIGANKVLSTMIAANAVETDKIKNSAVTPGKLAGGTANQVLTTDATGAPLWQGFSIVQDGTGTDDQDLTLSGNNLSIERGNSIDLSAFKDNTDEQTLANVLSKGNSAGNTVITGLGAPVVASDAVTKGYVDLELGDVEHQLNKNTANGYVGLGSDGKIDQIYLPAITLNSTYTAVSQAAQLGLSVNKGDIAIRTDVNKTYINTTGNNSSMSDWTELTSASNGVSSVNGSTGSVLLDLSSVLSQGSDAAGKKISSVGTPVNDQDAATKNYVDTRVGTIIDTDDQNLTLSGTVLSIEGGNTVDLSVFNDNTDAQTLSNVLGHGNNAGGVLITGLGTPVAVSDAATKGYVDASQVGVERQSNKNIADGYVGLGTDKKIDQQYLPGLTLNSTYTASGLAAQLALPVSKGDVVIRTDVNKTYINTSGSNTSISDWTELLTGSGGVTSVNGSTGSVVLDLSSVLSQGADAAGKKITSLATPTNAQDAATKAYVDTRLGTIVDTDDQTAAEVTSVASGDVAATNVQAAIAELAAEKLAAAATFSGDIKGTYDATTIDANKVLTGMIKDGEVKNADLDKANIPLSGFGVATADISIGNGTTNHKLTNLLNPTNAQDAATKKYVDDAIVAGAPDASGSVKGIVMLAGDLTGMAMSPQLAAAVVGESELATDAVTTTKIKDANVTVAKVANLGDGKILVGGTTANTAVAMGGDASITSTGAVTVDKIKNIPLDFTTSPTNGQVLTYNLSGNKWIPGTVSTTDEKVKVGTGTAQVLSTTDFDGTLDIIIKTGAITSDKIANGTIEVGDLADNAVETAKIKDANVTVAKVANLGDGKILVGGTTANTAVAMGGDVTLTNAGAVTVNKIKNIPLDFTTAPTNGQVLTYNLSGNKWIPGSVSTTDEKVKVGTGTAQVLSTTDFDGTSDVIIKTGAVTSAKIADKTIINDDVSESAAILGTKISPDFGAQAVVTTSSVTGGSLETSGNISQTGTGTFSTGTGAISLNGNTTMGAAKTLYLAGSTSGTIGLKGNGAVTSYSLTLPDAVGTAGQSLVTDASGNLSWADALKTSMTSLASGDVLKYNGTNWVNTTLSNLGSITLITGTTGTDVAFSSSPVSLGGTLTLNIPDAGATARGVVTINAQTFKGAKTFSDDVTTSGDAAINGGDLTTTATTATLFNTNATTLNIGGASTATTIGSSGTAAITTISNNLKVGNPTVDKITISGGNLMVAGAAEFDGNVWVQGNLNTPSDIRLKTNIETLTGVLAKIDQLRGVKYEFKDQQKYASGPQVGVVAQELQKVFPELVSQGTDGYLAVNYSQLTAVLIQAVKEQQQQIEVLIKRLDDQQQQINTLINEFRLQKNRK